MRTFVAALLFLSCFSLPTFAANTRPPNIVFLLTDDQGYHDLSCYGAPTIKTPRIDQMAAEGVKFTDFYVAAPVCTPSRAAIMTGCYPQRIGMCLIPPEPEQNRPLPKDVLWARSKYGLNPSEITMPKLLKTKGYVTQMYGKWHLGDRIQFLPDHEGFDHWIGTPITQDQRPSALVEDDKVIEAPVHIDTLIQRYTTYSLKFLEDNKDKPFFLYLAYNAPHDPPCPSDGFRGKSPRGIYGDVVEEVDWSTGKILDKLKELGIDKDTLVVFISDNGPWLIKGENGGTATPFRAGKRTTYEGAMHVPCIMYWPGHIPAGTVCHEIASSIDFYPTFANLAGAAIPTDRVIDGKDIQPLMFNKPDAKSPHEAIYYYDAYRLNAIRSGPWKLKFQTNLEEDYGYYPPAMINGDTPIPMCLYNLVEDPGEQKSVAKDHPDIVKRLGALADIARHELGDERRHVKGTDLRPIGIDNGPPDSSIFGTLTNKPEITETSLKRLPEPPEP